MRWDYWRIWTNILAIPKEIVFDILSKFREDGINQGRTPSAENHPDPTDQVFYEISLSVEDAYMVTNNKKHFPSKPQVVTPSEVLIILSEKGVIKPLWLRIFRSSESGGWWGCRLTDGRRLMTQAIRLYPALPIAPAPPPSPWPFFHLELEALSTSKLWISLCPTRGTELFVNNCGSVSFTPVALCNIYIFA